VNPIFLTLSLIDVIAGFVLVSSEGSGRIVHFFAMYALIKGVWSLMSSFSAGYYFDWMGAVDTITGICLLLTNYNLVFGFFSIIGMAQVMKGIYSAIRCL